MRLAIAAALLLAWAARASPHAFLDHAEPRVGSSVDTPPSAVTLTFTESVEPAFSRVELLDSEEHPVQTGALEHLDGPVLRVPIPELRPGTYTVHWSVVSVDTHPTEGRFTFRVEAARQ